MDQALIFATHCVAIKRKTAAVDPARVVTPREPDSASPQDSRWFRARLSFGFGRMRLNNRGRSVRGYVNNRPQGENALSGSRLRHLSLHRTPRKCDERAQGSQDQRRPMEIRVGEKTAGCRQSTFEKVSRTARTAINSIIIASTKARRRCHGCSPGDMPGSQAANAWHSAPTTLPFGQQQHKLQQSKAATMWASNCATAPPADSVGAARSGPCVRRSSGSGWLRGTNRR